VKIISEDFGNMGISNPTLGSNFPKEAIEKIAKLIYVCSNRQQSRVLPLTMNDVIDEINGALQSEKGQKAKEDVIKIEIPQYASEKKIVSLI
jgi:hypothetical protein